MITEIEQETSDIDWFFTNHDAIAFIASGGGKWPLSVSKLVDNSNTLSNYFRNLPLISEVIINPDLDKIVESVNSAYLEDFIEMAQKGIYSFDKTVLNNFSNTYYHLVAKPVTPLKFNQLALEIKELLNGTSITGEINFSIDVNSIT